MAKKKSMRRKVQEVIDGDTFRVRNRVRGSLLNLIEERLHPMTLLEAQGPASNVA